ncbi:hypothetical protein O3G_MSEX013511 [Manduca sexta]|uniref:Uncharacterized protein n=1 Tax=Manduca sexta TaxID=7130 RepID=A0A921ZSY0_MANSE|nr:hypothetical protein O3G_MSEX013511 [Manduca sexta]
MNNILQLTCGRTLICVSAWVGTTAMSISAANQRCVVLCSGLKDIVASVTTGQNKTKIGLVSAVEYQTILCNSRCWMVLLLFMGGRIAYHQAKGKLGTSFKAIKKVYIIS